MTYQLARKYEARGINTWTLEDFQDRISCLRSILKDRPMNYLAVNKLNFLIMERNKRF